MQNITYFLHHLIPFFIANWKFERLLKLFEVTQQLFKDRFNHFDYSAEAAEDEEADSCPESFSVSLGFLATVL